MSWWTIEEPTKLDFDGVVALKVMLVGGSVSVLATTDRPSVQITDVAGRPLTVGHEAGMLSVAHDNALLEGLLNWIRNERCSAQVTVTVPPDCPVQINLVGADAVITGLTSGLSIKSGTGDVTVDGVAGRIDANTVSGVVEAQRLDGTVDFTTVAGDLALAGGTIDRLAARSVNGRIAADIDLTPAGEVQVSTVSGEVTLRLPTSASAEVGLSTVGGRIDSSFAELGSPDGTLPKNVTGRLGDGTGQVSVNTVSGNITLLGRRPDGKARPRGEPDVEV